MLTSFAQLDGFGITGTPAHAYTRERRGTLVDQGWHRDSSIQKRYQVRPGRRWARRCGRP